MLLLRRSKIFVALRLCFRGNQLILIRRSFNSLGVWFDGHLACRRARLSTYFLSLGRRLH